MLEVSEQIKFRHISWCRLSTDLTQHATTLAHMMGVIATEKVAAPLFDASIPTNSGMNNVSYVQHYMANLLKQAFPHLQE